MEVVSITKIKIPSENVDRSEDKYRVYRDFVSRHGILNPIKVKVHESGLFILADYQGVIQLNAALDNGLKQVPISIAAETS